MHKQEIGTETPAALGIKGPGWGQGSSMNAPSLASAVHSERSRG